MLLVGCGEKSDVKNMIERFESSVSTLDLDGVMDCVNPSVIKPIRGFLSLMGVEDVNQVVADLFLELGFSYAFDTIVDQGMVEDFKIEPTEYRFYNDKNDCVVTVRISYYLAGEYYETGVDVDCSRINEQWYINRIGDTY